MNKNSLLQPEFSLKRFSLKSFLGAIPSVVLLLGPWSCSIYDAALLNEGSAGHARERGETTPGSVRPGDLDEDTPIQAGGGPAMGMNGDSSLGGAPHEPAGAAPTCEQETPAFDVAEFILVDPFEQDWPRYNDSTGRLVDVSGEWTTSSNSASYNPKKVSSISWEGGGNVDRKCGAEPNLAFRIESFDAQWISAEAALDPEGVDLSAFSGLIFHARSAENSRLDVAFLDGGTAIDIETGTLSSEWAEIRVPFAATENAEPGQLRALKFLLKPEYQTRPVHVEIDNVAFYR